MKSPSISPSGRDGGPPKRSQIFGGSIRPFVYWTARSYGQCNLRQKRKRVAQSVAAFYRQ